MKRVRSSLDGSRHSAGRAVRHNGSSPPFGSALLLLTTHNSKLTTTEPLLLLKTHNSKLTTACLLLLKTHNSKLTTP